MSKLLIVESPGKIKKISEYLGSDYVVMASIGHIIDLDAKTMSIDLDTFEPMYSTYNDKLDVVRKLKSVAIKVGKDNVYLAADEDREGEMIAWSLQKELGLFNAKRIVFNSITAKELKAAVANPKTVDLNMVYAQQARRILDRLAGYLVSPLLFKNGFKGAQSAGRVQSVVVKIIVDKEKEIKEFYSQKKSTFFYINCSMNIGEYEVLTKLTKSDEIIEFDDKNNDDLDTSESSDVVEEEDSKKKKGKKKNQINTDNALSSRSYLTFPKEDEDKVVSIIKAMIKGDYSILKITEKVRKSYAPAPFTTSTLQQYASQRFKMDAKRTMSVAQKLYEGGHITYMRTDSTSISDEAVKAIKETITETYGANYFEKHEFVNKKANTQEAHECVRPTKPHVSEIEGSPDEKKLYQAIWKRTIQSQMKPAEYQSILIEIKIDDKKQILKAYKLIGTLENLVYEGYLIIDDKKGNKPLDIKKLKGLEWIEINGIEDTFKPPVRYNDASLIAKMDPKNLNIGRPSTYASFIDKIQQRAYVEIKDIEGIQVEVSKYVVKKTNPKTIDIETKDLVIGKEKKKLVPTILGINITDFLELNFKMLMDYKFTANMEKELDDIAEGTLNKLTVIKKFYKYLNDCISTIKPIAANAEIIIGTTEDDTEIKILNGKFGRYIVCGDKKFNLKQLLDNNKSDIKEDELDKKKDEIFQMVLKQLENPTEIKKQVSESVYEWTKGKTKYHLKNGKFGYYIEEVKSNGKKDNHSMGYLIKKTAQDNLIDDIDNNIKVIASKITIDDIQKSIEYLKNMKKNKSKK
jgi:DNA topoisomerase-1